MCDKQVLEEQCSLYSVIGALLSVKKTVSGISPPQPATTSMFLSISTTLYPLQSTWLGACFPSNSWSDVLSPTLAWGLRSSTRTLKTENIPFTTRANNSNNLVSLEKTKTTSAFYYRISTVPQNMHSSIMRCARGMFSLKIAWSLAQTEEIGRWPMDTFLNTWPAEYVVPSNYFHYITILITQFSNETVSCQ